MREYGFSLTRILPSKDRIYDSVFIWDNTGQWKPVFSHILCSVKISEDYDAEKNQVKGVRKKKKGLTPKKKDWEEVCRKNVRLTSGMRIIMLRWNFSLAAR